MSELKLPPLQQTFLDAPTVAALFRDLAACTQVLSVAPKYAATGHTSGAITLEQAKAGLQDSSIRAVQIRYGYEAQEWCDTLIGSANGVRVVRISMTDVAATID